MICTRHLSDRATCLPLDNDLLPVMAFDRAKKAPKRASPLEPDRVGRQRETANRPTAVGRKNLVLHMLCFSLNLEAVGLLVLPRCPFGPISVSCTLSLVPASPNRPDENLELFVPRYFCSLPRGCSKSFGRHLRTFELPLLVTCTQLPCSI